MPGKQKTKPQVEGLSIFEKAVMVGPIELNVVDGPISWRTIKRTPMLVLKPLRSYVSCGGIVPRFSHLRAKRELFHRN